jgi:hypothetical protein
MCTFCTFYCSGNPPYAQGKRLGESPAGRAALMEKGRAAQHYTGRVRSNGQGKVRRISTLSFQKSNGRTFRSYVAFQVLLPT